MVTILIKWFLDLFRVVFIDRWSYYTDGLYRQVVLLHRWTLVHCTHMCRTWYMKQDLSYKGQVAEPVCTADPRLSNPRLSNPRLSNPRLSNPRLSNSRLSNPRLSNPRLSNPRLSNPRLSNPRLSNPRLSNSRLSNPRLSNPRLSNPRLSNPHQSEHSDYPTYPLHWYSIIQNSIVAQNLYYMSIACILHSVFVCSNIGFSLQLTHESPTTCMHESTMIPYACTCSCSSLFHVRISHVMSSVPSVHVASVHSVHVLSVHAVHVASVHAVHVSCVHAVHVSSVH